MSKAFRNIILIIFVSLIISPHLIQAGAAFGRGKPQSECAGWIVFNSAWLQRFAGSVGNEGKSRFLLNGDLGFMKNVSPSQALGASFYMSGDDDGSDLGVMARYKKFIDKKNGYDLCAGILLAGDDNYIKKNYPGFIFQASFTWRDWIGLMFQAQVIGYDKVNYYYYNENTPQWESYGGTQTEFFLGLRFGSYAALIIPVAVVTIIAIVVNDWEFELSN